MDYAAVLPATVVAVTILALGVLIYYYWGRVMDSILLKKNNAI